MIGSRPLHLLALPLLLLCACRFDSAGVAPKDAALLPEDTFAPTADMGTSPADTGSPDDHGETMDVPLTDLSVSDTEQPLDPLTPFGMPRAVNPLNTAGSEDDPTLTGDMLEIYFERDGDIWRATRSSLSTPWSTPAPVAELNSPEVDATPGISSDGLILYLDSTRLDPAPLGYTDIYMATRPSRGDPWSTPVPVVELNSTSTELCAFPSPDLLTLVFDSNRPGGLGLRDLYMTTRSASTVQWGTPQTISELNTVEEDQCPWINGDLTVLFFASNRPGGSGDYDIWITTRASASTPFAPPQQAQGINSSSADTDPWISPDMKTIYFASIRDGSSDIFMATR